MTQDMFSPEVAVTAERRQARTAAPEYFDGRVRWVLGIDPGLTGAIACLNRHGYVVSAIDMPLTSSSKLRRPCGSGVQDALLRLTDGDPQRAFAYIERAQSMPKQKGAFNYGVGFGVVLAVLEVLCVPFELVTPQAWKKAAGLSSDKRASIHAANRLFPGTDLFRLAKHDGRAEAALIARHGWSRMGVRT